MRIHAFVVLESQFSMAVVHELAMTSPVAMDTMEAVTGLNENSYGIERMFLAVGNAVVKMMLCSQV